MSQIKIPITHLIVLHRQAVFGKKAMQKNYRNAKIRGRKFFTDMNYSHISKADLKDINMVKNDLFLDYRK